MSIGQILISVNSLAGRTYDKLLKKKKLFLFQTTNRKQTNTCKQDVKVCVRLLDRIDLFSFFDLVPSLPLRDFFLLNTTKIHCLNVSKQTRVHKHSHSHHTHTTNGWCQTKTTNAKLRQPWLAVKLGNHSWSMLRRLSSFDIFAAIFASQRGKCAYI